MKVNIAIMAHNEEGRIAQTIRSLAEQSLIAGETDGVDSIKIFCIANGCKDRTVEVAKKEFSDRMNANPRVTAEVCELEMGSKINAWNHYVHQFSESDADVLMMMDADVWFDNVDTLKLLVTGLLGNEHANIAAATTIKRSALKEHKTLRDRISVAGTTFARKTRRVDICGMLYCGRAPYFRQIHLPMGMLGEDQFMMKCCLTSVFTHEPDFTRAINPPGARVIFDPYLKLSELVKLRRRLMVSMTINQMLIDHVQATHPDMTFSAGLKKLNDEDPDWLRRLVRDKAAQTNGRLVSRQVLWGRFRQLREQTFPRNITYLPIALIGTLINFLAYRSAVRSLRQTGAESMWK